jgi:hypothetical protein
MNGTGRMVIAFWMVPLVWEGGCAQDRHATAAGPPPKIELQERPGVSLGMGVSSLNVQDIVDVVNSIPGLTERAPRFKSCVDFFGAISFPLSADWVLKAEYSYLLGSFTMNSSYGTAEFTVAVHAPSLIAQYVIVDEGVYNVEAGAGLGYHFGSLSEKFVTIDDRFTGGGLGVTGDVEGNTALGEHLFAYLGANVRWDFIGEVKNGRGNPPGVTANGARPTLHFFGFGARLGFTYYF